MNENYYKELALYLKHNDIENANNVIMRELAMALVKDKSNFIEVLRTANILMPDNATDMQLVTAFVDNAPNNRKLLLGAAYLVSHLNQKVGFDGSTEINDSGMKATYKTMYDYFDASQYEDVSHQINGDYYNADEEYYNAGGFLGTVFEKGKQLVNTYKKGRAVEKGESGDTGTGAKQNNAKAEMAQALLEKRRMETEAKQKQAEQKAKTMKIVYIVGGSVIGLALIVGVIYMIKKSKKQ